MATAFAWISENVIWTATLASGSIAVEGDNFFDKPIIIIRSNFKKNQEESLKKLCLFLQGVHVTLRL